MNKIKLSHSIEYGLYLFVVAVNCLLPWRWIEWNADRVGDLFYLLLFKRRQIALENLSRVYPEADLRRKKEILRRSLRNTIKSVMEIILVSRVVKSPDDFFTFTGLEYSRKAAEAGKSCVYALSHLGSWEYMSIQCLKLAAPGNVIVKNLRNPLVNRRLNELRSRMAVTPLAKDDPAIIKKLFTKLRDKEAVGILIDQWAGPEGIWVDFFGEKTSTTSMPYRLAKKADAVLIPGFCIRRGSKKFEIIHGEPIASDLSEEEATLEANKRLEAMIRKYPEQWNWVHRRWKPKPKELRIPD